MLTICTFKWKPAPGSVEKFTSRHVNVLARMVKRHYPHPHRFVCLDLDCVIVGDMTPLWHRPEDFVIWGRTNPTTHYNGSMMLMSAGARPQVWEDFDACASPSLATRNRQFGSDQGWISYRLGKGEAIWTEGVYGWVPHLKRGDIKLPDDARIVFFNGKRDNPWDEGPQGHQWVRESWR